MPRISEYFAGSFFKAEELPRAGINLVIEDVEEKTVGRDTKLVVIFHGEDKALPLNKTNAKEITKILNEDDTDRWPGGEIKLVQARTDFQGKRVLCIRIEPADEAFTKANAAAVAASDADAEAAR